MEFDGKGYWEEVYRTRGPTAVGWYQAEPSFSLELIRESNCGRATPLIDVGAGSSLLVDFLLAEGWSDISLLDISGAALQHVRERLADRAERVHWIEGDVTAFEPRRRYGFWHDRAVFHFLTDSAQRAAYLDVLDRAVESGGFLQIAAFALDGPERCSGLPVVRYDAQGLSDQLGPEFRLLAERRELHRTPGGVEQSFGYYLFRRG